MTLHVLATFIARPEAAEAVRALLASMVEPIRQDPGCTRCHLVIGGDNRQEMVFVEEWRGGSELDRHLADPFIASVVERVAPLLAEPLRLGRYDAVD